MKNRILKIVMFVLTAAGLSSPNPAWGRSPFTPQTPRPVSTESDENQADSNPLSTSPESGEAEPAAVTLPAIKLSGIVWETPRPQAIVNDQVVSVGDEVADIQIVDIQKEKITVKYRGVLFPVSLN